MKPAPHWTPGFGFQSRRAIELAISFAKLAKQDSDASLLLYKNGFYAHAIFSFQQAVEKFAKAVGLLLGFIEPTPKDLLVQVGHLSLLGILIRLPDMIDNLPSMQKTIRQSLDRPEIKATGFPEFFERFLKPPSVGGDAIRKVVEQLRSMDSGKAWKATLSLDQVPALQDTILGMLKVADQKAREAKQAFFLSRKLHKLIRTHSGISTDIDFVDYLINISGVAVNEVVPLALLSMWHEQETRYPPISENDSWDPWAYTEDSGLIRLFPKLHRHCRRLCRTTLAGAQSVLRGYEREHKKDGFTN